jgi:hypothetical protein
MKKMYFLLVSLLLTGFLNAQTLLSEDFSSGIMPPAGWTALPLTSGWDISSTALAGGSSPECKFEGFAYNGTCRLMSPYTNMTTVDTAVLMFKHFYKRSGSGLTIGLAIANGSTWVSVWEKTPNQDIGPEEISIMLTGDQISSSNFRFSFYLTGNMASVQDWYIDDVLMFAPSAFDCKLANILVPSVITGPVPVMGSVVNLGNTIIDEVNVTWVSYSGIERDSTFSGLNLSFLQTAEFSFDGMWISPSGQHNLKMFINSVNGQSDLDPTNDTLVKPIEFQTIVLPRVPLFEEFTSSTCGPCASFNSSFVPWCTSHEDDITLVKYQMNWPGSGDPYYTAEGGTRRAFYGVSFVPDLFCNGANVATNVSNVNTAYNNAIQLTSTLDIASTFTISGSNINITTNILPFASTSSLKVFNIVIEKVTTQNVATNGETEFHHVMMKMMPDANGASTSFVNGTPVQFSYNYDLSSTNVEEYDDLMIAVIVQDASTKEVKQTAYGLQNTVFSNEARLSSITLDGVPLEGFDPNVYEYDVQLPEGTVEEPVIVGVPMNSGALMLTSMAFAVPGTAMIDVYAENLFTHKQYKVNYSIDYVGTEETPLSLISVYPNPAHDQLNISGLVNARLTLYSSTGSVVLQKNNFSGTTVDISHLSRGVYVLDIKTNTNQVIRKKITVL